MGRDWLKHIHLNLKEIGVTIVENSQTRLKSLLEEYCAIFKDELGTMNSIRAELLVKEDAYHGFIVRARDHSLSKKQSKGSCKGLKNLVSLRKSVTVTGQLRSSPCPRKTEVLGYVVTIK